MSFCLAFLVLIHSLGSGKLRRSSLLGPKAKWEIQPINENPKEGKNGGKLKFSSICLQKEADWRMIELPESRGDLKSSHLLPPPPDPTT